MLVVPTGVAMAAAVFASFVDALGFSRGGNGASAEQWPGVAGST